MRTLVTQPAPDFTAQAVMADGSFATVKLADFRGQYVALFFYPLDFTFVCPSEIIAHHNRVAAFKERNVQLLGVSIDSIFSHHAWRETPVEKGGIGKIDFPLIADTNHAIGNAYGILIEDGAALRATFLIDKDGIVQHEQINNRPLGREVDELLRLVDALQFTEEHGEVCPAGWRKGKASMKPTAEGVAAYLAENAGNL